MYNNHVHNKIYHPKYFLGKLTPFLESETAVKIYRNLNPFCEHDILDRYARFIQTGKLSERQHLQAMVNSHRIGTKFIINTVDLSQMNAGTVKKPFIKQVTELLETIKEFPQCKILLMVDPRVEYIDELYNLYSSRLNEFAGIKIYPNIGYTILDKRLKRFFDISQNKVCTVHCTDTTPVFYKGKDLEGLLDPLRKNNFFVKTNNRKKSCGNFAHPHFTIRAAQLYPYTNFNLAHYGGSNHSWRNYIDNGIKHLENLFYDISSTYVDSFDYKRLKINDHTLYGNDWDMCLIDKCDDIESCLSIDKIQQLENNAKKWLRIE